MTDGMPDETTRPDERPDLSLVVSTIGRPESLRRLLTSLEAWAEHLEVIVVDQSADGACRRLADGWDGDLQVRGTTSARGVSLGRNTGAREATGRWVSFPDDDAWYAADTVQQFLRLASAPTAPDILAGIQHTADGRPSMLRYLPERARVTPTNLHRTIIESALFVRCEVFAELGGFDETIGVGSAGPYQSGEGADVVLRALDAGFVVRYEPSLVILQNDPRDDPTEKFVEKMAGYGAGFGYTHRRRHQPAWLFAGLTARKAAGATVRRLRGQRILASADVAFLRSAYRGYRDGGRAG
jgi:glycosyltransferase involved in cell wall biosynthesis